MKKEFNYLVFFSLIIMVMGLSSCGHLQPGVVSYRLEPVYDATANSINNYTDNVYDRMANSANSASINNNYNRGNRSVRRSSYGNRLPKQRARSIFSRYPNPPADNNFSANSNSYASVVDPSDVRNPRIRLASSSKTGGKVEKFIYNQNGKPTVFYIDTLTNKVIKRVPLNTKVNSYVAGSSNTAKDLDSVPAIYNSGQNANTSGANSYIVRRGDTLWRISQAFNVPVQSIRSANGLGSDFIRIGQKLVIPF